MFMKILYVNDYMINHVRHIMSNMIDHVIIYIKYFNIKIRIFLYSIFTAYVTFYSIMLVSYLLNPGININTMTPFLSYFWLMYICISISFQNVRKISILGLKWRPCL